MGNSYLQLVSRGIKALLLRLCTWSIMFSHMLHLEYLCISGRLRTQGWLSGSLWLRLWWNYVEIDTAWCWNNQYMHLHCVLAVMRWMQIRCVRGEFHHSVGIMPENSREQLSCTAMSTTICMHSLILHVWSSLEYPSVDFNVFGATLLWEMTTDGQQLPDARLTMTAFAPVAAPWSDMNQTKTWLFVCYQGDTFK